MWYIWHTKHDKGRVVSEETRRKISEAKRKNIQGMEQIKQLWLSRRGVAKRKAEEKMKIDVSELKLINLVINEKGFSVLEGILRKKLYDSDNLSRVSGNTFEDGVLKGVVAGFKIYLHMIEDIRQAIKEMEKEGK